MEGMAARALKSSLRRELNQQVFFEDFCGATGITCVSTEDFSVDDLLDLPNGEFEDGSVEEEEEKDSLSVDENSNSSNFSGAGDSESPLASELAVPVNFLRTKSEKSFGLYLLSSLVITRKRNGVCTGRRHSRP